MNTQSLNFRFIHVCRRKHRPSGFLGAGHSGGFCQTSRRFGGTGRHRSLTACQAILTCFPPAMPKVSLSHKKTSKTAVAAETSHCCQILRFSVAASTPSNDTSQHNRHEFGRSRLAPKGGHSAPHPRRIEADLPNLFRTSSIDPPCETSIHCSVDQICPSCAPSICSN